jgi:hypothetical protein
MRWGVSGTLMLLGIGWWFSPAPSPTGRLAGAVAGHAELRPVVKRLESRHLERLANWPLQMSEMAPWQTICRRLGLGLIGSGPSLEELRWLESLPEGERVEYYLESLLADRRWSDYFAERLTRALIGTQDGPFLLYRRRRFTSWLSEQLAADLPLDALIRQLIAAEGLWTDNPAVNFLTATMDESDERTADPVRLAGRTSRAFLGMRIDCLQCHDDLLGQVDFGTPDDPHSGRQLDFHGLAAFFAEARVPDNVFSGLRDDPQRTYQVELLGESEPRTLEPQVPFHRQLLPADGSPRQRLAAWLTDPENKPVARAWVNRIWGLMTGRPLIQPVDQLPLSGPFPVLLEELADDLTRHGWQLTRLIRLIALSAAFQRSSDAPFPVTAAHLEQWAVFPMSPLRSEQLARSILQASRLQAIRPRQSLFSQLEQFGFINDFLKAYGDRGDEEFLVEPLTLPQRLTLMNAKQVAERIEENPILNASHRIARQAPHAGHAVELVYRLTFARSPTHAELDFFASPLTGLSGRAMVDGVADLYWMLINSTEFQWNR